MNETWSLDRKIAISLIVAVFLNTLGVVWWASNMSSRVEFLEKTLMGVTQVLNERISTRQKDWDDIKQRMAKQEAFTVIILETLKDITRKLDDIKQKGT